MNLYIFNKKFERIAVIDNYSSLIWTPRYYECGDFELYLRVSVELLNMLQEDYYITREGDEELPMIIETIQITTDVENGNYLTVKGRCLKSIFYRRIIWDQTTVSGTLFDAITQLLNENAINPSNSDRKIGNITIEYDTLSDFEIPMISSAQFTGDNLGETITTLCLKYGTGWRVEFRDAGYNRAPQIVVVLYAGVDRSYNQHDRPPVVFSNEYDNLLTTDYTFDKSNFKNVAKVAGEGEGKARKNTTVGNATGLDRYELFVDADDISSNEGEISDSEYYEQLTERGLEKLAENTTVENFEGEVIDYNYAFGRDKDYYIGDIVEIENEYGMTTVARVTEVIESEDESGTYTIPTFSTFS